VVVVVGSVSVAVTLRCVGVVVVVAIAGMQRLVVQVIVMVIRFVGLIRSSLASW